MKIGAHVSIAGGLLNSIPRAKEIGANTIQIFFSAPQNWNPSKITDQEAQEFAKQSKYERIDPVFAHAIYLVNLATENPDLISKSKQSLITYLNISSKIHGGGVIFHIGANKEKPFSEVRDLVTSNMNDVLDRSNPTSILIIETNAGHHNSVGTNFDQIAEIINNIKDKSRIGVCLDTAHIFESGYDIANQDPKIAIDQFNSTIGLQYLKAIHCNDSKSGFNSHWDRHENIGEGQIGKEAFKKLLHLPQLADIPFILEVPGFDNKGPDKQNIEILKKLAG